MSSILTNNGAMVALQTLKGINSSMAKTQDEISTGKSVATAKDNAAVWAIAKTMESDVSGFKAIGDALSLGESSVAVARTATESVTKLLDQIKTKVVASQGENVDRATLQKDIDAMSGQIKSIMDSAQFNGLNLVNGTQTADVNILSSLDRASDGTVTAAHIAVTPKDLTAIHTAVDGYDVTTSAGAAAALTDIEDQIKTKVVASQGENVDRATLQKDIDAMSGQIKSIMDSAQFNGLNLVNGTQTADVNILSSLDRASDGTVTAAHIAVTPKDLTAIHTAVDGYDVTTSAGAAAALTDIEDQMKASIEAAASFGSVAKRIETQSEFVSKLADTLTSGIGALVDANMEEVSARLQALQVQQQLGTQSLSIANQAPQALLSLFRG